MEQILRAAFNNTGHNLA